MESIIASSSVNEMLEKNIDEHKFEIINLKKHMQDLINIHTKEKHELQGTNKLTKKIN